MHRIFIVLALISILACSDRKVQLPMLQVEGVGEIQNHSGIWIFYEANEKDTLAVMNKNNKLQNTHWIFHIDKRLPMGRISPLLNEMQADHDKESMHKKEGMLNYFSFADSRNKRMSLLPFDKTYFILSEPNIENFTLDSCTVLLEIRRGELLLEGKVINADEIEGLETPCKHASGPGIQLIYSETLDYEHYLKARALLDSEGLITREDEWVIRKK